RPVSGSVKARSVDSFPILPLPNGCCIGAPYSVFLFSRPAGPDHATKPFRKGIKENIFSDDSRRLSDNSLWKGQCQPHRNYRAALALVAHAPELDRLASRIGQRRQPRGSI